MSVALGLASAACHGNEGPTAPDYGFVRVTINPSGGDLDADGYDVILDGSQIMTLKDVLVESFYVASGEHTVSIAKVADNCTVTGPTSRTVSVTQGQFAFVTFDVVCAATGIAVTARTTGFDRPDNLRIMVDDGGVVLIAANGTRTLGRLTPGSHRITLIPTANCTVAAGNSLTVEVVASKVTDVAVDVSCTPAVRLPKIAYAADVLINRTYVRWIELVNVDGTSTMSLVQGDSPAWSPDGLHLALTNAVCPASYYYYYDYCLGGIILADPELGNVSAPNGGQFGFHPSWSPTGSAIAFHAVTERGALALKVMGTLTGAAASLNIAGPRSASQPAWSPDGTRIAFACEWSTHVDICVANADGTGAEHLTDDAPFDQEPSWSPDGTKVAFVRYPPLNPVAAASAEIAVMDLATRQITPLGAGADPAWSPDGSKLVFAGMDGLFVMNADGSGRTRLTTGPHHAPAWRP